MIDEKKELKLSDCNNPLIQDRVVCLVYPEVLKVPDYYDGSADHQEYHRDLKERKAELWRNMDNSCIPLYKTLLQDWWHNEAHTQDIYDVLNVLPKKTKALVGYVVSESILFLSPNNYDFNNYRNKAAIWFTCDTFECPMIADLNNFKVKVNGDMCFTEAMTRFIYDVPVCHVAGALATAAKAYVIAQVPPAIESPVTYKYFDTLWTMVYTLAKKKLLDSDGPIKQLIQNPLDTDFNVLMKRFNPALQISKNLFHKNIEIFHVVNYAKNEYCQIEWLQNQS